MLHITCYAFYNNHVNRFVLVNNTISSITQTREKENKTLITSSVRISGNSNWTQRFEKNNKAKRWSKESSFGWHGDESPEQGCHI